MSEMCMNEGCANAAPHRCAACRSAHYCCRACQRGDWRRHRRQCGAGTDTGAKSVNPFWAMASGGNGDWHRDLPQSRVLERLVMSFQLRVEDEYVFNGELCGTYLAQHEGLGKKFTRKAFKSYLTKAEKHKLLPDYWTDDLRKQCLARAEENGIHFALEKNDVVERFGYASCEHVILRSLAEHVMGPINEFVKLPREKIEEHGKNKHQNNVAMVSVSHT